MLSESADIYRQLLPSFSPKKQPAQWGLVQHSRAKALHELALRCEPAEALRVLAEAEEALRAVLPAAYSRERAPEEWAAVQQDLGGVTYARALLSGRAEKENLLGQAIALYRLVA